MFVLKTQKAKERQHLLQPLDDPRLQRPRICLTTREAGLTTPVTSDTSRDLGYRRPRNQGDSSTKHNQTIFQLDTASRGRGQSSLHLSVRWDTSQYTP